MSRWGSAADALSLLDDRLGRLSGPLYFSHTNTLRVRVRCRPSGQTNLGDNNVATATMQLNKVFTGLFRWLAAFNGDSNGCSSPAFPSFPTWNAPLTGIMLLKPKTQASFLTVVSVLYRVFIAQHSAPVPHLGKHCFSNCLQGSISPLSTHSSVLLIYWWREVISHSLRMHISRGCSLNSTIYRALWLWTWDHTHMQRMGWTMEKGASPAMENTHKYTCTHKPKKRLR